MDYMPQFGQNVDQQMPQDDSMMQLELQRRLKFADALRQQEAPQGQMVSGHYVAPSWTQNLANLYGKYQAGQQEKDVMKQYGEAQTAKAQKYADLLGETDPTKFQQGLAQMPEFALELVKNRLSMMGKEDTPIVAGPGSIGFNRKGEQIFSVPNKPEKPQAPVVRNMRQGMNEVTQQWNPDTKTWSTIGTGPAFKPDTPVDKTSVENTASMIASGQIQPLSGFAMKSPWGQQVMSRVKEMNPDFSGATFGNVKQAEQKFNVGKQGDTVRSLNVATNHLDTLGGLADALNTGNVQLLNKATNAWKTQTGQAAPTNFEGAKKIVADEVVKAIVGSGGGVADREEAARSIQAASSPAQLRGVINTYKELMHGQLNGLRQQYEQSTGKNDFDRFLSTQVKTPTLTTQDQQALNWANANPNDPRAAAIKQKLKVQ